MFGLEKLETHVVVIGAVIVAVLMLVAYYMGTMSGGHKRHFYGNNPEWQNGSGDAGNPFFLNVEEGAPLYGSRIARKGEHYDGMPGMSGMSEGFDGDADHPAAIAKKNDDAGKAAAAAAAGNLAAQPTAAAAGVLPADHPAAALPLGHPEVVAATANMAASANMQAARMSGRRMGGCGRWSEEATDEARAMAMFGSVPTADNGDMMRFGAAIAGI